MNVKKGQIDELEMSIMELVPDGKDIEPHFKRQFNDFREAVGFGEFKNPYEK